MQAYTKKTATKRPASSWEAAPHRGGGRHHRPTGSGSAAQRRKEGRTGVADTTPLRRKDERGTADTAPPGGRHPGGVPACGPSRHGGQGPRAMCTQRFRCCAIALLGGWGGRLPCQLFKPQRGLTGRLSIARLRPYQKDSNQKTSAFLGTASVDRESAAAPQQQGTGGSAAQQGRRPWTAARRGNIPPSRDALPTGHARHGGQGPRAMCTQRLRRCAIAPTVGQRWPPPLSTFHEKENLTEP